MPIGRRFRVNLLLLIGILVSGVGLSEISIGRIEPTSIAMMLVGPVLAIALLPRSQWMRIAASICLMAGTFGIARIASEVGHEFFYGTPRGRTDEQYLYGVVLFGVYFSIWVAWYLWQRGARLPSHSDH